MSLIIYKYPITEQPYTWGRFTVMVPRGARILDVQAQEGRPHLWALVDPGITDSQRLLFQVWPTGHVVPGGLWGGRIERAWTLLLDGGAFVLHVMLMKNLARGVQP